MFQADHKMEQNQDIVKVDAKIVHEKSTNISHVILVIKDLNRSLIWKYIRKQFI